MLRVPLSKPHIQRTLRVLYGWTQTTPKDMFLDPEWDRSTPVFPGMVAMKTSGDMVTLINGTGEPEGLFGLYIGGDGIDEVEEAGVNAVAVWVLGPDAEFEVLAPAFDTDGEWEEAGDGTPTLVYAHTTGAKRGKLTLTAGTGKPVARLLRVAGPNKIVIGGLRPGDGS